MLIICLLSFVYFIQAQNLHFFIHKNKQSLNQSTFSQENNTSPNLLNANHTKSKLKNEPKKTCSQPLIRKEWRELSEAERQDFINANLCLKKRPSKLNPSIGSPSVYDDLVYVHLTANDEAHKGVSLF